MEAIANGPLPQLFALMLMPILAALFLGGYVIFSMVRRRKKSKMKHGIHRSNSEGEEIARDDTSAVAEVDVTTTDLSSNIPPAPASSSHQVRSIEDKLDLGLLGKSIEPEVTMEEPSKPMEQEAPDLAARLTPLSVDSPPPPQPAEAVELLRLLRDPESGQLIVEIAGQRYTKLASVTDKKIGQYILRLTAHLLAFTNGVIITDAGMKTIYNPKRLQKVPMPVEPSATSRALPSRTTTTSPPISPRKTAADSAGSPDLPPPSPETGAAPLDSLPIPQYQPPKPPPQAGGLLGRMTQATSPPPSMLGLNLAEEINDIVQTRLRYSPLAENNRIEITSDDHGGIRIEVNRQFYSSPDEVPDPDIKELIKAAIKEWERK